MRTSWQKIDKDALNQMELGLKVIVPSTAEDRDETLQKEVIL